MKALLTLLVRLVLLMVVLSSAAIVTPVQASGILFVKSASSCVSGCGGSWSTAYPTLQDALIGATEGEEIWVMAGIYKPGTLRADTFQLKDNVAVYCGFAGTETSRAQRNPVNNETILSGDLNGDDVGFINNSENAYHVVTGANGPTLDGFTVIAGNANGGSGCPGTDCGGGMFNSSVNSTIMNVTFSSNSSAGGGGGIANMNGTLSISDSTISNNESAGYGAGIINGNPGTITVTHTTFANNTAVHDGGGINSAGSLIVTNGIFIGNTAYLGGGILVADGTAIVTNSTFTGNSTSGLAGGAGIMNAGGSAVVTVTNSTFNNNYADGGGGALFNGGTLNLTNSTLLNNTAYVGGGIENFNNGTLNVTNSTMYGNSVELSGGGIYSDSGTVILHNTIVANSVNANCSGIITADAFNLDTDGSCSNATTSALIKLSTLADNGGPTQTMALQTGSSAIDTGDDVNCLKIDQREVTRPQGSHCDIGAYELDTNSPSVLSIIRASATPTSVSSVDFIVTFSEPVTGVDATAFFLTTTDVVGTSISTVMDDGDHITYTVTVITGSGDGTIRLDVVDNNSIMDAANNPLGGTGVGDGNFTGGETYSIIKSMNPATKWTSAFDLSHGWTVQDYVRTVGDVNGDGKADLVGFGLDGVYVALSDGSSFAPTATKWTSAFDLSHGWMVKDYVRTVGDVNGDGVDDLVGFGLDGVYVALSDGSSFAATASKWTSAFDLSHGWTVADYARTVGDVNGDGKDDLVGFGLDGVYIALSDGSSFAATATKWTNAFDLSHGWTVKDYVRTVGDVNGDGKADLVGFGLDGVYVALSSGTDFYPISKWTSAFDLSHGWTVQDYVRTVGDMNGDGKDDAVGFGLDGVYVALSSGTDFYPISKWTSSFDKSHGWTVQDFVRTVGDVNGDGKDDLVGFGLDGVYVATAK